MKESRESHLRVIYDHAYQFLGLLSPDGTVLAANPAALRQVGASDGSIIGTPFWQTPWWDHAASERKRLREAIGRAANGEFVRFETTHPNGRGGIDHIDFSLTPICDGSGTVVYLLPEGRRINALKAALDSAAEGERRFRELAELLPETVYEMDATGRFTYVNQKAFDQFGYEPADFDAGANALDMIIPADHQRAIENMARIMDGQRVYHNEYTCLRKDGSTFPGHVLFGRESAGRQGRSVYWASLSTIPTSGRWPGLWKRGAAGIVSPPKRATPVCGTTTWKPAKWSSTPTSRTCSVSMRTR
jgi:PAS domain S-box-containing protein